MNRETIRLVKDYMHAHEEEIVRDLMRLARIPSIRSEAAPHAPFGLDCRAALDEAVALFRERGFDACVMHDGAYGIASYGEGDASVGLFGHTDVVPVGDDWVYTKPFEPIVSDGHLIGRGVEDNKAGVVLSLYVLLAHRELSLPMHGKLLVFLGAAEETGMEDIAAFCEDMPMPRVNIVPDNAYPVCLGEKGICHLLARAKTPFTSIREFRGGLAYNVILDTVEASLKGTAALAESLDTESAITASFSAPDTVALRVKGLTAHASMPDGSINAAHLAASRLAAIESLDDGDRAVLKNAAHLLETVHGEVFGIATDDPHFGPVSSANGIAALDDGHLTLSFDIRYGTALDSQEMERAVREVLDAHGFEVVSCENRPGFRRDEEGEVARRLISVYREVSGHNEVKPFYSGGGTYCRHLPNSYSIGTAVPYIKWKKDFPAGHGEAHQSDETIVIEGLVESCAMATLMVASCISAISASGEAQA